MTNVRAWADENGGDGWGDNLHSYNVIDWILPYLCEQTKC